MSSSSSLCITEVSSSLALSSLASTSSLAGSWPLRLFRSNSCVADRSFSMVGVTVRVPPSPGDGESEVSSSDGRLKPSSPSNVVVSSRPA